MKLLGWKHTGRFCLASFCMDFSSGVFTVALPYFAMELGADSLALGKLSAIRSATYVLALLPASFCTERINRKLLIGAGALCVALTLGIMPGCQNLRSLLLLNMAWAVSLSVVWPSLFAWLADAHIPEHLGAATGAANLSWSVGSFISGVIAGRLFLIAPSLAFLTAAAAAFVMPLLMLFTPEEYATPKATDRPPSPRIGRGRELAAAWLGSAAVLCLFGAMFGVFPKLGTQIGVTSFVFGVFYTVLGLGRSVIFLLGLRWGRKLCDWRWVTFAQLVAAFMVGSVRWASDHLWLGAVFISLGVAVALAYYRGLYASLEGSSARGLKSGMHEAMVVSGYLVGAYAGGGLAEYWHIRAPYLPIAAFVFTLILVQVALTFSAQRAVSPSPRPE